MPFGLPHQFDYLQLRLDILSSMINSIASPIHEREFGVSVRELRVLRFAKARPGLTLGQLTQLTALEKTIVSKLVSGLVKSGWLTRHVGVEDARHINLRLTKKGMDLVSRADSFSKKWQSQFLSALTQEELRALLESLEKLTVNARKTVKTKH